MTASRGITSDEPNAAASGEQRRGFVTLAGLFLAGPVIWIVHFMAVYLVAEALCVAGAHVRLFGLPLVSTLTLIATVVAVGATLVTTLWSHRRWRASAVGGNGSGTSGHTEQEGSLALAGVLLGLLFILAILFTGVPAIVLAC